MDSGPTQEGTAAALPGRDLETAQAVGGQAMAVGTFTRQGIEPEQGGGDAFAAQGFDAGPEGVARILGEDQAQALKDDAGSGPGRCMGDEGRGDEDDGVARGRDPRQDGQQQGELADAGCGGEQFGELATGPAAARQFGIEGGESGGKSRRWRDGDIAAPPDVGAAENGRQGRVHGMPP